MLKIEYFIQFCPNYILLGIENLPVYEVVTFHENWVKNVELAALQKLVRFFALTRCIWQQMCYNISWKSERVLCSEYNFM